MKILHVNEDIYPALGGLELAIKRIAEEQVSQGHQVHVLTSSSVLPFQDTGSGERWSKDIRITKLKSVRAHYPALTMPLCGARLDDDFDVVHIHSQASIFNWYVAERFERDVPRIITFLAVRSMREHPSPLRKIGGGCLDSFLTNRMVRLANISVVLGNRDREVMVEHYGVSPKTVSFGVTDDFKYQPEDSSFAETFGLVGRTVILYVGRLDPGKGPQLLVRAMSLVRKRIGNATALFVGPGDWNWLGELAVSEGVEGEVMHVGVLSERMKVSAFDSATCVVVPSTTALSEAFSIVVSEAFSRKKPVVASDVGELTHRVVNKQNGFLFQSNSVPDLARKILQAVDTFKGGLPPAAAGKVITWADVAKEFVKLYKSA